MSSEPKAQIGPKYKVVHTTACLRLLLKLYLSSHHKLVQTRLAALRAASRR